MKMDDDPEVAVTQQLSLNNTDDSLDLWEDDFTMSAHKLSLNESSGSGGINQQDQNDSSLIQKCFEFIRKHAKDADPEFILSLLQSEIDNPRGLEMVMYEILNIPNALELIREFKKSPIKAGDKRGMPDSSSQPTDAKKKKKDTNAFLRQLKDMFPDADGLFLITECQQLEDWEDFSRFVNTVMLSGIYPKKGAGDDSGKLETSKSVEVVTIGDHVDVDVPEEEVTSLEVTNTKGKQKQQKRNEEKEDKEVIDLTDPSSLDTEIYEPPSLDEFQESFKWGALKKAAVRVQGALPNDNKDDFRHETIDLAIPGPSGEGARRNHRRSLPEGLQGAKEKSLAEIFEEKRKPRRKSESTGSRAVDLTEDEPKGVSDVGDGAVASTSQVTRTGTETDGPFDEGEVVEEWLTEQTANLMRIFPNTDPSYLREQLVQMNGSAEAVNEFVVAKLEKNDMPSKVNYEKRLEMEELQNRYTKNFSIEYFLKAVPDPWKYFTRTDRNCAKYKSHSLSYLKSTFRKRYVRDIVETFDRNNFNLYLSYKDLKKGGMKTRSSQRSIIECHNNRPTTIDIQFLQEVAFIENEEKIKNHLEVINQEKKMKYDEAKRAGTLLECQCCFDAEVLVEDMFYCPNDHAFCRTCITRSVEVEIGYGRHKFVCLTNCEEKFTLQCLQNVLSPELFSKVIKAIQMEEIRAAEIEDLVQCPFCNYATILPPEEKVLTCLNPECMKESCRLCNELNHIPLRCDEIEKSEEVKMRTYIENKMTEALVRTCYNCGKKFVKEDGCNKMTCTCGAKMCYVCRRPVTDYTHFNGQGGTEYHKCPLHSTNDELHVDLVKRIGEEAKAKVLRENPNTKLIYDPTALTPQRQYQRQLPGVNHGAALDVAVRAVMGGLEPEGKQPHRNTPPAGDRFRLRLRERELLNRNRRETKREANPHPPRHHHRHHYHRPRVESDIEDDDDDDDDDFGVEEDEEEEDEEEEDYDNHHPRRHQRRRCQCFRY